MIRLGIDIGGSSVKVAVLEDECSLAQATSDRYANPDAARLSAAIKQALDAALSPAGPGVTKGLGVTRSSAAPTGLCAPGLFDPATGCITASANLPSLVGINLAALLTAATAGRCGEPTIVTDAYAAAFDFWSTDLSRAPGRFLALSLGTGVGACVLDDGVALRVSGSSPGHIGQVDVTLAEDAAHPPIAPDGGAGGLEAYIGLRALQAQLGENVAAGLAALSADAKPIRALVRALRISHALYRPQTIALLGGVGTRLGHLVGPIQSQVSTQLTSVARPGWQLRCGTSDFHAARGAALLAKTALAKTT